jgi:hypothetical protein
LQDWMRQDVACNIAAIPEAPCSRRRRQLRPWDRRGRSGQS